MGMQEFFDSLGRALSRKRVLEIDSMLKQAGFRMKPEIFAGFVIFACASLSLSLLLFLYSTPAGREFGVGLADGFFLPREPPYIFLSLAVFSILFCTFSIILLAYAYLSILADSRKREVEGALPDFLLLASANMRAGMSLDQALWQAARPEFGVLSKEVEYAAKRTFAGEPLHESLDRLAQGFNSRLLKRTIALLKQSLATGGKTAAVLEETAEDARNMQILSREISSSLLMYVIFIVFAAVLGAPFLLAVSHNLISVLSAVFGRLPDTSVQAQGGFSSLSLSKPPVTEGDFYVFSLALILFTCIISALLIGIIQRGSRTQGIKYLPFLIIGALVVYFAVRGMMAGMLAGFGV